ncbi:MAG: porin family protein [Devosia sp.]
MRKLMVASAALLMASPALAADMFLPYDPEPYYAMSDGDWGGQYLGATIGGQRTRIDVPGQGTLQDNGFIGGLFAGYNVHQESLVYGVEADAEWSSFDQSIACTNPAWTCRGYVNFQGSLRARLGMATDSFHVYGTAGLAVAHAGGSTTSPANVEFHDSSVRFGWTVGAGAEIAFNESWFGRAEYRYTDLGSRDMTFDVAYPGVTATSHALRAGIGYRF